MTFEQRLVQALGERDFLILQLQTQLEVTQKRIKELEAGSSAQEAAPPAKE